MRTVFTFQSLLFNSSESRDYFNPGCFGDDVARWLIAGLRSGGVSADAEPYQEDFGWFVNFDVPDGPHSCVVGFRPEPSGGLWIGWVERRAGFIASLLGGRHRGITVSATEALHAVLSAAGGVDELRWHERPDFDAGREDLGSATPNAAQ